MTSPPAPLTRARPAAIASPTPPTGWAATAAPAAPLYRDALYACEEGDEAWQPAADCVCDDSGEGYCNACVRKWDAEGHQVGEAESDMPWALDHFDLKVTLSRSDGARIVPS